MPRARSSPSVAVGRDTLRSMVLGLHERVVRVGATSLVTLCLVGSSGAAPARAAIPYADQLTPGTLRGIAHAPGDPWLYGYWEYLPESFDEYGPGSLPLLVFMAGVGEYDDVPSCPGGTDLCDPSDCGGDGLCRNLTWGPQQLIRNGQWDDVQRPFIVISPQHPVPPFTSGPWNVDMLDDFLQFVVDNYPVDPRRMYLIGMSQGGRGALQFTQAYPRRFTAIAPAPGGTVDSDASCYFQDTALWAFHGENDAEGILGAGVFNPCAMVNVVYQYENPDLYVLSPQCLSIVGEPRPPGRITMFDNVAHFAWVQTVDPIGSGFPASEWPSDQGCNIPATYRQYSAALDPDGVYSWFLSLDRPRVVAPDDLVVDEPMVSLPATITDDDPVTITWTQTGGPPATLADADTDTLEVTGLLPLEQYTFEVYVVDADEQWDLDEVIVTTDVLGPMGGSSSSGGGEASTGTSTSDDGPLSGSSSGGGGDSSSGTSSGGVAETSAGVSATTGGEGPVDDTQGGSSPGTTSLDDTGAGPGTSASASDSGVGSSSGGRETDDAGADPESAGGCGCRSETSPPSAWAWALVVLAAIRRRRER